MFFFHNIWGPLRSVSLHTILGAPAHFFLPTICPPPPPRSVSLHAIEGPPQISFFTKYMWTPSDQFLRLLYGTSLRLVSSLTIWRPLRSVSVHTFWGPLSDRFFSYYTCMGPPQIRFLHTIWSPLRSVSSHTIWGGGGPQRGPLRSVSSLTI